MFKWIGCFAFLVLSSVGNCEEQGIVQSAKIIDHSDLKVYTFHGNSLQGVATQAMGAQEFEVWRSSWAVGGGTPKHTHNTEEIFIFLKGKGRAVIGDEEFFFEAPCTIICPANVPHELFNVGDEPTDSVLIMGPGSTIWNADGKVMNLPWRN